MKKTVLLLSLALAAAGFAGAAQATKTDTTKAPKTVGKTHEVKAEIAAVDATAKTITIKGETENKTVPVKGKAVAGLKDLKAGDKVTLTCQDNEKGEHQAVVGIAKAAPEVPAKK